MNLSFTGPMDFMGSGRWPETNGPNAAAAAAAAAAAWAMTEQYILPAGTVQHGAVFIPMKTCARKRPTDVEEADNQALPSFSEVRQSTTSRAKRRKEVQIRFDRLPARRQVWSASRSRSQHGPRRAPRRRYTGEIADRLPEGRGNMLWACGDRSGPNPAPPRPGAPAPGRA